MIKKYQGVSPRATKHLEFIDRELVAVVQMQELGKGIQCHWTISGVSESGEALLVLELKVSLQSRSEVETQRECAKSANTLFQIARSSLAAGGLVPSAGEPEGGGRAQLALVHMGVMDGIELLGDRTSRLSVRTSRQYSLCKSFGLTSIVKLMAQFEGVPITTVQRRLAKARNLGLIEKRKSEGISL